MGYALRVALVMTALLSFLFGGLFLLPSEGPYGDPAAPCFVAGALLLLFAVWPLGDHE